MWSRSRHLSLGIETVSTHTNVSSWYRLGQNAQCFGLVSELCISGLGLGPKGLGVSSRVSGLSVYCAYTWFILFDWTKLNIFLSVFVAIILYYPID